MIFIYTLKLINHYKKLKNFNYNLNNESLNYDWAFNLDFCLTELIIE